MLFSARAIGPEILATNVTANSLRKMLIIFIRAHRVGTAAPAHFVEATPNFGIAYRRSSLLAAHLLARGPSQPDLNDAAETGRAAGEDGDQSSPVGLR